MNDTRSTTKANMNNSTTSDHETVEQIVKKQSQASTGSVEPMGQESSPIQKSSKPVSPDPSDLNSLWAPVPLIVTRTKMMTIRAGTRPPKDKFIQVLPFTASADGSIEDYLHCRPVLFFEYQFDGDLAAKTFYVSPGTEVAQLLQEKERLTQALLVLGVVRNGSPFVWELKLPNGQNESADNWARSRFNLAKVAETKWIKPKANIGAGGYDYEEPVAPYDPPNWDDVEFDRAIELACKDRVISTLDHDAVKEALGR